jgi:hypothetical protein
MEEIQKEFEEFLKNLIVSYKQNPQYSLRILSLQEMGERSRSFNRDINIEIEKMATNNNMRIQVLKIEMSRLIVKYNGMLMH